MKRAWFPGETHRDWREVGREFSYARILRGSSVVYYYPTAEGRSTHLDEEAKAIGIKRRRHG